MQVLYATLLTFSGKLYQGFLHVTSEACTCGPALPSNCSGGWACSSEECCTVFPCHAGEMNEATLDANFRPGNPLFNAYPLPLYQPVYTAHFVQLLLTNWRKGARDFRVSLRTRRVVC